MAEIRVIPLKFRNKVLPGDNWVSKIISCLNDLQLSLMDGDVLVISAKVVSIAEGLAVKLSSIQPTNKARELAKLYSMDPHFTQLVLDEADFVVGGVKGALLTVKRGIFIANAGVDLSNAPPGCAVPWPRDPDGSAFIAWQTLKNEYCCSSLGVILSDSRVQPLRLGTTGVAIATCGFQPVIDLRGREDLFNRPLKIKQLALADLLASAAILAMGEASELTPAALIRGVQITPVDGCTSRQTFISPKECLFSSLYPSFLEEASSCKVHLPGKWP
ncbi:MAG: coenzyme F420-0:L-glutamate ligase [Candidatus Verstraetearchaeota archaeon]|nr:coenzyme F420-0:L-glutamate ligase [Candidatus Verstraetearchaeota archaeon]